MGRSFSGLVIFVLKRLVQLIPVVFGVATITFIFTRLAVRDPCAIWYPKAKPAVVQGCIHTFGLDQPIPTQFVNYLGQLLRGDWGNAPPSLGSAPVLPTILSQFPATLELVLTSLFLMVVIGIPLGVVAANANGRIADHLVRIFYLSGWATPTYLAAVLLAIAVGPVLGLPVSSATPPPYPTPTHFSLIDAALTLNPSNVAYAAAHLALPAVALAFLNMGIATRMTRSSMLEVLPLDYVKTARMKGLTQAWVLYKHALRNSLITTVTVLGITAGGLLSGTVVIESIFSWPGIGKYAYQAIVGYNFPGTVGVVIVFAVGVVVANLIADVLYGILDPRVEWR